MATANSQQSMDELTNELTSCLGKIEHVLHVFSETLPVLGRTLVTVVSKYQQLQELQIKQLSELSSLRSKVSTHDSPNKSSSYFLSNSAILNAMTTPKASVH